MFIPDSKCKFMRCRDDVKTRSSDNVTTEIMNEEVNLCEPAARVDSDDLKPRQWSSAIVFDAVSIAVNGYLRCRYAVRKVKKMLCENIF